MTLWQGNEICLVEKYENELDTESIPCRAKKQIEKVQQNASIQVAHAILYWPAAQTHKTPAKLTTQTHKNYQANSTNTHLAITKHTAQTQIAKQRSKTRQKVTAA